MQSWTVAAAQVASKPGDIALNIARHLDFIACAAKNGVELLVFPEFSLTGLPPLPSNAYDVAPEQLVPLARSAAKHQMTIMVGLPHADKQGLPSAALSFLPDGGQISVRCSCQEAQALYPVVGQQGRRFSLGFNKLTQHTQPVTASPPYADLYASGQFIDEAEWVAASASLQAWSRTYRKVVLMANHAISYGEVRSGGRSACWDEHGQLVVRADEGELLAIGRRHQNQWYGEVVPLSRE